MKINFKKIAVLALAGVFLTAGISSLAQEVESRKLSIMQTDGKDAYVIKGADKKYKAFAGMSLAQGNQLKTGKNSSMYIETDNDTIIKLSQNSEADITKASPKSLKMTLNHGDLFFNVDKPLAEDEELTFKAAHTSMSIRGTAGIFSYDQQRLRLFLLDGKVLWDLGDEDGTVVEILPGQSVALEPYWIGTPGPGNKDCLYRFVENVPFHWRDLDDVGLEALMENRHKYDLSLFGLDDVEELKKALAKVEELVEARTPKPEPEPEDENDDGWRPVTQAPQTTPSAKPTEESKLQYDQYGCLITNDTTN